MRVSIFNLDNKKTYKDEYNKIVKVLKTKCVTFNKRSYTYFDYINTYLFNNWKYRGTYLDCYEYLEFIGVNINSKKISLEAFINFMEFILNIESLKDSIKHFKDNTTYTTICRSILFHNIPLIIESLGYKAYSLDNKVLILKKDIDYEDLYDMVPDNIYELLLSYNSVNNNGIRIKRMILNKIYNYMQKDIDKYRNYNSTMVTSIKIVVTKMGVLGIIDKKYTELSNYKLKKYYDYCYSMMIYLIKTESVLKYRDTIRNEG